jgi:hypothetical protein
MNPDEAAPRRLASRTAMLPFILASFGVAIAHGASPRTPFFENALVDLCLAICAISLILFLIPKVFNWDWKAKYFGATLIYTGAPAFFGIIPWLSIVSYSALPLWACACILLAYGVPIFLWCRRYNRFYQAVFNEKTLRNQLYVEEDDAVYYLQKADQWLLEKKLKLDQCPSATYFLLFAFLAFLTVPFAAELSRVFGLPYVHIFLPILSLPIVLLCAGLSTRGYLIFYHFPAIIKKQTGKDVYVDMETKPTLPKKSK